MARRRRPRRAARRPPRASSVACRCTTARGAPDGFLPLRGPLRFRRSPRESPRAPCGHHVSPFDASRLSARKSMSDSSAPADVRAQRLQSVSLRDRASRTVSSQQLLKARAFFSMSARPACEAFESRLEVAVALFNARHLGVQGGRAFDERRKRGFRLCRTARQRLQRLARIHQGDAVRATTSRRLRAAPARAAQSTRALHADAPRAPGAVLPRPAARCRAARTSSAPLLQDRRPIAAAAARAR